MKCIYFIFIAGFLNYGQGSTLKKLIKEKVLKDYNKEAIPADEMIHLYFYIHKFDIYEYEGRLSMLLYIVMDWNDRQVKWDAKEFGNLTEIVFSVDDIMVPELVPLTNNKMSTKFKVKSPKKHIHYFTVDCNGKVNMLYSTSYSTICKVNTYYWPNDEYTCKLRYSALPESYNSYRTRVLYPFNQISQEWTMVINPSIIQKNITEPEFHQVFETELTFKRRSSVQAGIFHIPSLLFMAIILVLMQLNPQSTNRIVVLGVVTTIECGSLHILRYQSPPTGSITPLIVYYLCGILMATFICVMETIFLRNLLSLNSCPLWLYSVNCYISQIKIFKRFTTTDIIVSKLMESDEEECTQEAATHLNEVELEKNKLLESVVKCIDKFVFFVILVTFVTLIFIYFINISFY